MNKPKQVINQSENSVFDFLQFFIVILVFRYFYDFCSQNKQICNFKIKINYIQNSFYVKILMLKLLTYFDIRNVQLRLKNKYEIKCTIRYYIFFDFVFIN